MQQVWNNQSEEAGDTPQPQKCEDLKRILSNHILIYKILFYFKCHVLYAVAVCENILIAKALGDRVASISEFCRIFSFAT